MIALPLVTGCMTLQATFGERPETAGGMLPSQQRLRDAFAGGDFPSALRWQEEDDLLSLLTRGTAAFYAGQYARSAAVLDTAALLADNRITISLSREALTLVTNDMARAYDPRRTERLLIPYYGMLAYVQLAQWEDAAVEARRLVSLLAQFEVERDESERTLMASMSYLAGAAFECAGEKNEAAVAYRAAHALVPSYPVQPMRRGSREGDVLLVFERGFIAHRATEMLKITLDHGERGAVPERDGSRLEAIGPVERRRTNSSAWVPVEANHQSASPSQQRVPSQRPDATGDPEDVRRQKRRTEHDNDNEDENTRRITIALPVLRRSLRSLDGPLRIVGDRVLKSDVHVAANLDDASSADERRDRASMISRAVGRAGVKYAVTKAVRDRAGTAGKTIARVGDRLAERADVRSWHLLPQEVVVIRVRAVAGTRLLQLDLGQGSTTDRVTIGAISVRPGGLVIRHMRLWHDRVVFSHTPADSSRATLIVR